MILRRRHLSRKRVTILSVLIVACVIAAISLFIMDAKSQSDGGLPGALAMFFFIPLALIFASIIIGPFDVFIRGKKLPEWVFVLIAILVIGLIIAAGIISALNR